ncbi:hypothetical protein F4777DRAFT_305110 [Nemania sp. FL0916]|nr:hypothetical protein F4777DRAFT_305110 [Nemania sp. FL0916]
MAVSTRAGALLEAAARRMSSKEVDPFPASSIEILGIGTATCLLAFFACSMFCTAFRLLWIACSSRPKASNVPSTTKASGYKGGLPSSICEWPLIPSDGSRTSWDGQRKNSLTPHFRRSACDARMKIYSKTHPVTKQYSHTRISAKHKSMPRKPLTRSTQMITSIRRKGTTLDMEEGLISRSNPTLKLTSNYGRSSYRSGTVSCREPKVKREKDECNKSFLHCRTASL